MMTTKLKIKNFGSIKEGEIDLSKRFYLFVGYNNSGKSYVSQLLWAIFHGKTLHEFAESVTLEELNISEEASEFKITNSFLKKLLKNFSNYIEKTVIPDTLKISSSHFAINNTKIEFDFNIDSLKSIKTTGSSAIALKVNDSKESIVKEFVFEKEKDSFIITIKCKKFDNLKSEIPEHILDDFLNGNASKLSFFITLFIINELLFHNKHKLSPFFLPASRSLYLSFYEYVFSVEKEKREKMTRAILELLEKKGKKISEELDKFSFSYKSPYTEPVNFLMNRIYKLNEDDVVLNTHIDFIEKLEVLFGGDIVMEKREGIAPLEFLHRINKEDNKKLSMSLASSSVNQLSTLYLFFRYWVKEENNFLVVDEPEENLHPENQIALLNLLLSFCSQNNNHVLITTHSPLIAEMVSNYYCMAALRKEKVNVNELLESHSKNIDTSLNLSIDEMGVYFFNGTSINEYKMQEYGVFFEDFVKEQKKSSRIQHILAEELYKVYDRED